MIKLITKSGKTATVFEMPKLEIKHFGYNEKEKGFHLCVLDDSLLLNIATKRTRRLFGEIFTTNENEDTPFYIEACKKQIEIYKHYSIKSGEYELLEIVK